MTNELEKQFFDTFGIKKELNTCEAGRYGCPNPGLCIDICSNFKSMKFYPQITDRILLELICIANKAYIDLEGTDIETMKNSLLENFIFFRRDVYDQVRTLFEEG